MSRSRNSRSDRIKAKQKATRDKRKNSAFRVFEAGTGSTPLTLIKKAQRTLQRGKNRFFVGVDERLNLDETLHRAGIKKSPKNLSLAQQCAIDALLRTNPESQHVVFGSYLVNNLNRSHESCFIRGLPCEKAIFVAAEHALRRGGD
jgi:hypothetical protein